MQNLSSDLYFFFFLREKNWGKKSCSISRPPAVVGPPGGPCFYLYLLQRSTIPCKCHDELLAHLVFHVVPLWGHCVFGTYGGEKKTSNAWISFSPKKSYYMSNSIFFSVFIFLLRRVLTTEWLQECGTFDHQHLFFNNNNIFFFLIIIAHLFWSCTYFPI